MTNHLAFTHADAYPTLPVYIDGEGHTSHYRDTFLLATTSEIGQRYHLKQPNGLLIYGAPGCGKTLLAESMAQMTGLPYIIVNRLALMTNHEDAPIRFAELMEEARRQDGAIIILEDIETLLPNREAKSDGKVQNMSATLLPLVKTCGEHKTYLFATTSRPQDVDMQLAFSGYIDDVYCVDYPDEDVRETLITTDLKRRPIGDDINIRQLVEQTADYTHQDILSLINAVSLRCAQNNKHIQQEDFIQYIRTTRKPFGAVVRSKYAELRKYIEGKLNTKRNNAIKGFSR